METNNQLAVSGFVDTPNKYQKKQDIKSEIFNYLLTRDDGSSSGKPETSKTKEEDWLLEESIENFGASSSIASAQERLHFNLKQSENPHQFGLTNRSGESVKANKVVPQVHNANILVAKELYEQTAFAINKLSYVDAINPQLSGRQNLSTQTNEMKNRENMGFSASLKSSHSIGQTITDAQHFVIKNSVEVTSGKLMEKEGIKYPRAAINYLNIPEKNKVSLIETENASTLYIRDHFSSDRDVMVSALQMLGLIKQKISKMFINGREI